MWVGGSVVVRNPKLGSTPVREGELPLRSRYREVFDGGFIVGVDC